MTSRPLTNYEKQLVIKLLEALPSGAQYSVQLDSVLVSPWAGDSSLKFEFRETVGSVDNEIGIPVEGEFKDVDGVPIHVLLHVKDGKLHILEIYKENGSEVVRMPPAAGLEVVRG
jgi:hypothetical protein